MPMPPFYRRVAEAAGLFDREAAPPLRDLEEGVARGRRAGYRGPLSP